MTRCRVSFALLYKGQGGHLSGKGRRSGVACSRRGLLAESQAVRGWRFNARSPPGAWQGCTGLATN